MPTPTNRLSRRALFQLGAGSAAVAGLGCAAGASPRLAAAQASATGQGPKNIIFLVSDGMSMGVPSIAQELSLRVLGRDTALFTHMRARSGTLGYFETHSLDALVTDSAAASTSWGSGSRVNNGAINVLPDGTKLTPILKVCKDAGMRTGLVTTTRVTHATPAGFASVAESRGSEDAIAPQYLNVVDVVMGGGLRHYAPDKRRDDKVDVLQQYIDAGYRPWSTRMDLFNKMALPQKCIGLFADSDLPYEADRLNSPELSQSIPSLAEMTDAALKILSQGDNGFFIQVEGARIDHGAHANDSMAVFWDQIAFDDACKVALAFAAGRNDTLVVITSDHGNANPGLTQYDAANKGVDLLQNGKGTFVMLGDMLGQNPTRDALRDAMLHLQGVTLTDEEAQHALDAWNRNPPTEMNQMHRDFNGVAGQVLGNHTTVQWVGDGHTEDHTMILAKGPGEHLFGGLLRNDEFFGIALGLLGLQFENPRMTLEEGRRFAWRQPTHADLTGVA